MNKRYLAIEIRGEIYVMNDRDELGGLIDSEIPHTVIGKVCDKICNTDCDYYRTDTCPCKLWKIGGVRYHVFVDAEGYINKSGVCRKESNENPNHILRR